MQARQDFDTPVYLPADDGLLGTLLHPGSAVVGLHRNGHAIVYYEGNLYRAHNMVTFADRAMVAYWRLRDAYPTVATACLDRSEITQIGMLHPAAGIVDLDGPDSATALADWLKVGAVDLARELHVEGIRRP